MKNTKQIRTDQDGSNQTGLRPGWYGHTEVGLNHKSKKRHFGTVAVLFCMHRKPGLFRDLYRTGPGSRKS